MTEFAQVDGSAHKNAIDQGKSQSCTLRRQAAEPPYTAPVRIVVWEG